MPTVPPLPKDYSAEMICPDGDRTVLYVRGVMERFEMYPKTRPPRIAIRRPDKGVEWSLLPHTNTYSETVLPSASEFRDIAATLGRMLEQEWKDDGTEMIAGRRCWKFVGWNREAIFSRDSHIVCYVDAQTGTRRRECHYDVSGELVATIDYLAGSPPRRLFELPEGCKRVYHSRKGVILATLQSQGRSWRDYFFVGDSPLLHSWSQSNGLMALVIADDRLANACKAYVIKHGAKRFASDAEVEQVFGPSPLI